MSWKNKSTYKNDQSIKKNRIREDPEETKKYEELKNKYANAVVFLLIKNIPQSELGAYFESSEENKARYETLEKFRNSLLQQRPRAKQWIDRGFYLNLKMGETTTAEDGSFQTSIILGDKTFDHATKVVSNDMELNSYLARIAAMYDAAKIWSDPDMARFDFGERQNTSSKATRRRKRQEEGQEEIKVGDTEMDDQSETTEIIDTSSTAKPTLMSEAINPSQPRVQTRSKATPAF